MIMIWHFLVKSYECSKHEKLSVTMGRFVYIYMISLLSKTSFSVSSKVLIHIIPFLLETKNMIHLYKILLLVENAWVHNYGMCSEQRWQPANGEHQD